MPIMQVMMLEGRTDEQKEAFIAAVTEAAVRTVDVQPEAVRIMIIEMPPQHFGIAGRSARALGR